jgi:phage tail-like protein
VPSLGLNAAYSVATNMLGVRLDPFAAFNFLVEIEGLLVGGFSEVGGLQIETEFQDYREGGLNEYIHKLPGPTRYPQNLVLKHGLTAIDALWDWHQEVVQGTVKRRNGTIYLLDRQGLPLMWWDFLQAYPVRWTGPDLRADTSEVAFETVELVHRGITKPQASRALAGAQAALGVASQLGL